MWSVMSRPAEGGALDPTGSDAPGEAQNRGSTSPRSSRWPNKEALERCLSDLDPTEFLRVVRNAAKKHFTEHEIRTAARKDAARAKIRRKHEIDSRLRSLSEEESSLRREREVVLKELSDLQDLPCATSELDPPSLKFAPQLNLLTKNHLDATCSVCLDAGDGLIALPCGHFMHFGCSRRLGATTLRGCDAVARFNESHPLLAVPEQGFLFRYHQCPMCKHPLERPSVLGESTDFPSSRRSSSSSQFAFDFAFPSADSILASPRRRTPSPRRHSPLLQDSDPNTQPPEL